MLPAVVICSIVSGLVALFAAIAMNLSIWVALLGYSIGGAVGLLGIALVANVMSGRQDHRAGMSVSSPAMDGMQNR